MQRRCAVRWRIVGTKPDLAVSLQLDCSKLTGSTVVKRMVVIAHHRMALTLISHKEVVSQEASLNFGVEDYDDDEEHPEQNWFFGINIKTCKILVKPLGQHDLFMVALFLSG